MARPRSELSEILHEFCDNVYFQPPTGTKIKYPCIIYKIEDLDPRYADNRTYSICNQYSITYITRDPDDNVKYRIVDLPMCRMTRSYTEDNLYHYAYRLYF